MALVQLPGTAGRRSHAQASTSSANPHSSFHAQPMRFP